MLNRRHVLIAGLFLSLFAAHAPVQAQAWPQRTVRIVVPYVPGGPTDLYARIIAKNLSETFKQQFIVDNKPGAATRIAMDSVVRAGADGYTLGVANAVTTIFPLMFDNFAFTPGKDFVPVSMLGRAPSFIAVRASLPARNVSEFIAYARANNGKLSFGQGSSGSNPHLSAVLLVRSLGVQATEVPYKGNAPTALALGAGEIDFAMLDYASVRPLVERGNARLIAVTEPRRVSLMPDVPTSGEQGLTREIDGLTPWFMLVAPAGTPPAVVGLLNRHVVEIIKLEDVKQALASAGVEPESSTPEEALAYFQRQRAQVVKLAQELKLSLK